MSTITFTVRANDGSYNAVEEQIDKSDTLTRLTAEIEEYDAKYVPITYKLVKRPNTFVGGEFDFTITLNSPCADKKRTKATIVERFNKENSGTFTGAEITSIKIR